MKKIIFNLFAILCFTLFFETAIANSNKPLLILDAVNQNTLPQHFRTSNDTFKLINKASSIGLKNLHIIGSAQFSALELNQVIKKIKAPIVIFDLRQESHGFINGNAVSWYADHDWANLGKTTQQIIQDEQSRLNQLKKLRTVIVYKILKKNAADIVIQKEPITFQVKNVFSEQKLANNLNLGYHRIYVADHTAPTPQEVDEFIQIEKKLPSTAWRYFHCHAGDGRTTTFMAMDDMMHNAKQVSLPEIIKRQYLLGGVNLFQLVPPQSYKYKAQLNRKIFLENFYQYCLANKNNNFQIRWSIWSKVHTIK